MNSEKSTTYWDEHNTLIVKFGWVIIVNCKKFVIGPSSFARQYAELFKFRKVSSQINDSTASDKNLTVEEL